MCLIRSRHWLLTALLTNWSVVRSCEQHWLLNKKFYVRIWGMSFETRLTALGDWLPDLGAQMMTWSKSWTFSAVVAVLWLEWSNTLQKFVGCLRALHRRVTMCWTRPWSISAVPNTISNLIQSLLVGHVCFCTLVSGLVSNLSVCAKTALGKKPRCGLKTWTRRRPCWLPWWQMLQIRLCSWQGTWIARKLTRQPCQMTLLFTCRRSRLYLSTAKFCTGLATQPQCLKLWRSLWCSNVGQLRNVSEHIQGWVRHFNRNVSSVCKCGYMWVKLASQPCKLSFLPLSWGKPSEFSIWKPGALIRLRICNGSPRPAVWMVKFCNINGVIYCHVLNHIFSWTLCRKNIKAEIVLLGKKRCSRSTQTQSWRLAILLVNWSRRLWLTLSTGAVPLVLNKLFQKMLGSATLAETQWGLAQKKWLKRSPQDVFSHVFPRKFRPQTPVILKASPGWKGFLQYLHGSIRFMPEASPGFVFTCFSSAHKPPVILKASPGWKASCSTSTKVFVSWWRRLQDVFSHVFPRKFRPPEGISGMKSFLLFLHKAVSPGFVFTCFSSAHKPPVILKASPGWKASCSSCTKVLVSCRRCPQDLFSHVFP